MKTDEKIPYKRHCAECGKSCEVPFRPSNDKPVYCNECFAGKSGSSDRAPRRDGGRGFGSKPSFGGSQGGNGEVLKILKELSSKMDSLTYAVNNISGSKKPEVKIDTKEVSNKETKTKEKVSKVAKKTKAKAPAKKIAKKKAK